VRSALEAHDIPVVINAEQHASMLGGIGGAFVPLHIYVDSDHAEEAAELLRDLRERRQGESDSEDEPADDEGAAADAGGDDQAEAAAETEDEDADAVSEVDLRIERRRRAGIVLLLSCFIPIGGIGHLLTGAWLRGLALAGVQVLAFSYFFKGQDGIAVGLFGACKAFDIVGALWRIYGHGSPGTRAARGGRLPVARMHLR
jgi:hypothetical protein